MKHITIGPKHHVSNAKTLYNCDYVISIQDAEDEPVKTPFGVNPENHRHFHFDDLTEEVPIRHSSRDGTVIRQALPTKKDMEDILAFFQSIKAEDARIYLHCFAGVSRSTATGFMLHCSMHEPGTEPGCMMLTERSALSSSIWPNELMVSFADQILGRNGAMIKAVNDWKEAEKNIAFKLDAWVEKIKNLNNNINKAMGWDDEQKRLKIDKPPEIR